MFHNTWLSRENEYTGKPDKSNISNLSKSLECSEVIIKILVNRGYTSQAEIKSYLKPELLILHDAAALKLMPNITEAVERLKSAYYKNEKIMIYGDYDTDGVISAAILYNFLKNAGFEVTYHIPDRFEEGYDINIGFVKDRTRKEGYGLIICVDCGTNAFEVREFITGGQCCADIIVCDHHEPVENIESRPEIKEGGKYIIVNPRLQGCSYPFKHLSGAGVVFKFIIAALRSFEGKIKEKFSPGYLKEILDLVAISTIADVMPLTGENRIIVKAGLEILKNTRNKGLQKIISSTFNIKKDKFTVYDIGFVIAPRLNASGRINNAAKSINILTLGYDKILEQQELELEKSVRELEDFNKKRRDIQQEIFSHICQCYDFKNIVKDEKIFIEYSDKWHEGVLGIVASQIVKKFNIPAILFKNNNGILKGSGRSLEGFDLYSNLCSYGHYFIKYGGHSMACGITMEKELFSSFKNEITGERNVSLKSLDTSKKFYYDFMLDFSDINEKLYDDLKKMEPFGTGNEKPVFLLKNCNVIEQKTSQSGTHLFLTLQNKSKKLKAVFFNFKDRPAAVKTPDLNGKNIDILFYLNKTNSGGLQAVIQDINIHK